MESVAFRGFTRLKLFFGQSYLLRRFSTLLDTCAKEQQTTDRNKISLNLIVTQGHQTDPVLSKLTFFTFLGQVYGYIVYRKFSKVITFLLVSLRILY